jgi:uncharacterized membrane protein YheB (UPF0754 family)
MKSILFWIIPPLAGAFIGYFTNLVAIKMLFRPLAAVRLFGFRLPFTPGILPRERHKLADSIGRMVEQELLTAGVLRERLARADVREKIEGAIDSYTGAILERPLSGLVNVEPKEGDADFPISALLRDFVNSAVFDSLLEELIKTWAMGKNQASGDPDSAFGSWLKSGFRSLGAVFIPAARDLVKSSLVKEFKNEGEASLYRRVMESIVKRYPGITVGEFLSMGAGRKKKMDHFLADKTTAVLDDNVESALSSVNVKVLVSDRINSLEMLRVEKIILDVMAGQLQWINVFGAILGALIGLAQLFISLLTR